MRYQYTEWFDGAVKPARPGVYERISEECALYDFSKWDGRRWMCGQASPEKADDLVMVESAFQPWNDHFRRFKWRGIKRITQGGSDGLATD